MTTRQYSSRSQQTTLTAAITAGATSMVVVSGTTLLGGVSIPAGTTFTLVIDPDTALEEIVDATAVSTNTFTITRSVDTTGGAQAHSAGAVVRHMAIGRDFRDANRHTEADASYNDGSGNAHSLHGIAAGEGVVVGTLKAQTLTNKILTSPTISNPTITGTSGVETSIVFEGSTADNYETTLTVVDPTADRSIELPNASGRIVLRDTVDTLTNKTMGDALNAGGFRITNIATPVDANDAVNKTFADAQVAAAATSATSAATSASSAATSASSALTSANSASTSASSALTSANSAATSASSAQTFASTMAASVSAAQASETAAATSATSAATSATSAATSASSASTSASSALTSANSASTSATAAATSASSAATSATAAATSASSASTSASSALTSANSASTSASSASTSASSALTSANSAATSASSAATSYDEFDDRYLGSKSSDPTVDNDGNPLITGALYFNSVIGAMKVYDGAQWDLVAPDTSNFIDKSILTAKGSLISASTASTPVALTAPTTNGWILSADSATTSGLAWIEPNPGDITGVTAGNGLQGGGTSGSVTLGLDTNAKGDLIVGTGNDTSVILSVGSDNTVLTADSSTTSGLKWTAVSASDSGVYFTVGTGVTADTVSGTYAFSAKPYWVPVFSNILRASAGGADITAGSVITTLTTSASSITITPNRVWTSRNYPTALFNNDIICITNGNGTYVAGLQNGKLHTSTDLVTWTSRNANCGTSQINDVIYAENVYVLGTAAGGIRSSTDAVTWTTRNSGVASAILALGHSGTRFVACGGAGVNTSSDTGDSGWTAGTAIGTGNLNGVAYGNSTWVIVGNTGVIATSTDGTTWTTRSGGGTTNFSDVVYGDKFVAMSNTSGSGGVITSTDGITWTDRTPAAGGIGNAITYGGGGYMAVGSATSVAQASTDGITWTTRNTNSGAYSANDVLYYDGLFIAVGGFFVSTATTANFGFGDTKSIGTVAYQPLTAVTAS